MTSMAKRWAVAVVLCGALGAWAGDTAMSLAVGTQKVITLAGIQRVAIGDPDICDVKPIGNNQLLLIGVSEGTTTLMVWTEAGTKTDRVTYTITVTADPAHPPDPNEQRVDVKVGELKAIEFKDIKHVAVGDAEVADVKVTERELLLTGISPGVTTVLVWDKAEKRQRVKVTVTGSRHALSENSAIGEAWSLEVGATREIPRPVRVGVSDWDVCHLEDTPKSIVLRGHAPGTAEVTVTTADGKRTRHALTVGAPVAPKK